MKKIILSILFLFVPLVAFATPVAPPYSTWRYQSIADCTTLTGEVPQDLCKQTDNTLWVCTPSSGSFCTSSGDWHKASGGGSSVNSYSSAGSGDTGAVIVYY